MALERDQLVIQINLDSADANKQIEVLADSLQGLKKKSDDASDSTDDLNKSLDDNQKETKSAAKEQKSFSAGLGNTAIALTALNQGLELAKKAYAGVKAIVDVTTDAFAVQEKAELDLANALKIQGQFTNTAIKDFKEFASQLQNTTTIGDETTLGLLKIAKALGLSNEQSKDAVKAAAALSGATGQDLNSAFQQVTKTFGGFAGELGEKLPELRNLTKEQLRAGDATAALIKQFGGFAEAARDTFSGQRIATLNAYGDVLEEIGQLFVDVFDFRESAKRTEQILISIGAAIDQFRQKILFVIDNVDFRKIIDPLVEVSKVIGVILIPVLIQLSIPLALVALKFVAIGAAIGALVLAIDLLVTNAKPIGQIFTGIGAIIASAFTGAAAAVGEFVVYAVGQLQELVMAGNAAGVIPDSIAIASSNALQKISASVSETTAQFAETTEKAAEQAANSFENLEFTTGKLADGIIDNVIDIQDALGNFDSTGAQEAFENIDKSANKVKDTVEATKMTQQEMLALLQKQEQLRDEITNKNLALDAQIKSFGKGQIEQLMIKRDLELDALKVKQEQLRVEGKLTGEIGKQIDAGIEKQKQLIKAASEQQIGQAVSPNIISGEQTEKLGNVLGAGAATMAQSIGGALSAFSNPVSAMMEAVNIFANAIKSFLDFIPNILNSFADIFNMITDLPTKVLEAVQNLFGSVLRLISEGILKSLEFLPQLLRDAMKFAFQDLPDVIMSALEDLPDVFISILENDLPDIIERLVDGLVVRAPEIGIAITEGFIKAAPSITIALAKAFAVTIPMAIISGLAKSLGGLFKGIKLPDFKLPDAGEFVKEIDKAIKNAGNGAAKVANDVFALVDISQAGKARDVPQEAIDKIGEAITIAGQNIKSLWDSFLDLLRAAWLWVWENILMPIIEIVQRAWQWVVDNVLAPIASFVSNAFQWVIDKVLMPLATVVSDAFQWVVDNILNKLASVVIDAWGWVKSEIIDKIFGIVISAWSWVKTQVIDRITGVVSEAWNWVKVNILDKIGEFFQPLKNILSVLNINNIREVFKPLSDLVGGLSSALNSAARPFTQLADALNKFKIDGGGGGGTFGLPGIVTGDNSRGPVTGIKGSPFAEGGLVQGLGFIETPGEFVFNRDAVDAIGAPTLQRINDTGRLSDASNGAATVNINAGAIQINMTDGQSPIDAADIIFEELKRRTLNGELMIASAGVFAS